MILDDLLPLAAGIFATFIMTISARAIFILMNKPYRVIRILGNMLLFEQHTPVNDPPPRAIAWLATIIHYAIGILFAYIYEWVTGDGRMPQPVFTILYAIILPVVAIAGWRVFFLLHPGPPRVDLRAYLPVIAAGHVVLVSCLYAFHYFVRA